MAKVLILSIPEEEESLIDKIMAIINNPHDGQEIRSGKSVSVISIGKLQINITQHSVYKEGKEISLTGTEFKMLYYLASNKGMALSKDQIYNWAKLEKSYHCDSRKPFLIFLYPVPNLSIRGFPCRGRALLYFCHRWLPPLWKRNIQARLHHGPCGVLRIHSTFHALGSHMYKDMVCYCCN